MGVNPLHNTKAPPAPSVSLCVMTRSVPDEFHRWKSYVTALCLRSMLAGCSVLDRELIIWDNGSVGDAFKNMLRSFKPDVFVESVNQGCETGIKNMFAIARGKYLAYCDDDIFFYPGWWDKQFEVLMTYPNVASVSGSPMRYNVPLYFNEATIKWARENASVVEGDLMPKAWIEDAARSVCSGTPDAVDVRVARQGIGPDLLIEYKGVRAWPHGHHMQFICEKDVMAPFRKPSFKYMDSPRVRERSMAEAGLMRLTTHDRTCRHMGNQVDGDIRALAQEMGYL